jgi:hypothetical protein
MKNVVICCDGTGNEISENISNVLKFYRCLRKTPKTEPFQAVFYDPGVGTLGRPDPWRKLKQDFNERWPECTLSRRHRHRPCSEPPTISCARLQFAGASVDRLPAQMLAQPSKQPMPVLLALLRIALLSSLHDLFQFWKSKRHGYTQNLDVNQKRLQPHIHDVRAMSACAPTADISLQRGR